MLLQDRCTHAVPSHESQSMLRKSMAVILTQGMVSFQVERPALDTVRTVFCILDKFAEDVGGVPRVLVLEDDTVRAKRLLLTQEIELL